MNLDQVTSERELGPWILKVPKVFILSLKTLGHRLSNEAWWHQYCPISGHFFETETQKNLKLVHLSHFGISRLPPCESWSPGDSQNVSGRFWTGVNAAHSQKTVKFWVRLSKIMRRYENKDTATIMSFFVILPRKFSSGRRSDNIDASGLPNSSSESWRPEDSKNVVVFEIWRFWTGVMAAQSQLIRNRDTQKSCFSGSFLLKSKKCPFLAICRDTLQTNSSGHRSDNIDASGLPDSLSESSCPKVFREHVEYFGIQQEASKSWVTLSSLVRPSVRPIWWHLHCMMF